MTVDGGRVGGLEDAANAGLLRNAVAYAAVDLWVRRAQGCLCKRAAARKPLRHRLPPIVFLFGPSPSDAHASAIVATIRCSVACSSLAVHATTAEVCWRHWHATGIIIQAWGKRKAL